MIIREYISKDRERIAELTEKYGLSVPKDSKIIVAENSKGVVEGFVSVRPVLFIEPMISENPIIAVKLWNYVEEKMKEGGIKIIRCFAPQDKLKTYKKLGFYRIFNKMFALEKIIDSEE